MFFLEGTELFFPDILFDTAFLINFIFTATGWNAKRVIYPRSAQA